MHEYFTGKVESSAFAVERVLREAVEEGSELGVIDHFEVELLFGAAKGECEVDGDHRRGSAKLAGDGGEMVSGDRADGSTDVDDFGGSEVGGKSGYDFGASHGELHVAETQKGMAAEIDAVGANGGDGAGGTDGSVALHEDHASHIAGN